MEIGKLFHPKSQGRNGVKMKLRFAFLLITAFSIAYAQSFDNELKVAIKASEDELFENFIVSTKMSPPTIGDIFPNLRFTTVSGTNISTRGDARLLIIGGGPVCRTCAVLFEKFRQDLEKAKIKITVLVTEREIPQQDSVDLVDLRDQKNPRNRTGPFREQLGLTKTPAFYLLDSGGKIMYTQPGVNSVLAEDQLPKAIKLMAANQSLEARPKLVPEKDFPPLVENALRLSDILSTQRDQVSVIVLSNTAACDACRGLDSSLERFLKSISQSGTNVTYIYQNQPGKNFKRNGIRYVFDPNAAVAKSWNANGVPLALIARGKRYIGQVDFASVMVQVGGKTSPETNQPFQNAISRAVTFARQKK
jgi:hypothetical protein